MRLLLTLLSLLAVLAPAHAQTYEATSRLVVLKNSSLANTAAPLEATALFTQNESGNSVTVRVSVRGLQANQSYGVHIHAWGALSSLVQSGVANTDVGNVGTVGGHFDTQGRGAEVHGCPPTATRHNGDLGNLVIPAGTDPSVWYHQNFTSELLDLGRDSIADNSIVGRAIVIHEKLDTCDNGPLGSWVAVGVIGINDVAGNMAAQDTKLDVLTQADVLIHNTTTGAILGFLTLWSDDWNRIHLSGSVSGFEPNGEYGFHAHAYADLTEPNPVTGFGPHFGTIDGVTVHALPPTANRHWGDLGNVTADGNGVITFNENTHYNTELLSLWLSPSHPANNALLNSSAHNLIGRGIVIHARADNGSTSSFGARPAGGVIGLAKPRTETTSATAYALLYSYLNSSTASTTVPLSGNVTFEQAADGTGNVTVRVTVRGLQAGKSYGLHVHSWGDLSGLFNYSTGQKQVTATGVPTPNTVGGHFDVLGRGAEAHGCQDVNATRHTGDVGNLVVADGSDPEMYYTYTLTSDLLDLGRDGISNNSIVGRAIVIHENPDTCVQVNSGGWVAVGAIGVQNVQGNTARAEAPQQTAKMAPRANAVIINTNTHAVAGNVWFWTAADGGVHMSGYVAGFVANSIHGVHLHQSGNVATNLTIGGHYAPAFGTEHGLPPSNTRHWGDLGNLQANAAGVIIFDDIWRGLQHPALMDPRNTIIGRSIAFHEREDDGTEPSYGPRFFVGTIGLASPDAQVPALPANPNSASSSSSSSGGAGPNTASSSGSSAGGSGSGGAATGSNSPADTATPGTGTGSSSPADTTTPGTGSSSSSAGSAIPATGSSSSTGSDAPSAAPAPAASLLAALVSCAFAVAAMAL